MRCGDHKEDREHFVTRADAQLVLDACPDAEWRLIFALARFGGLRVPSELLALRWRDIDWGASRFRVTSPKKAHAGKASRTVPIFPELLPYLRDAFEAAEDGAEYVISKHRNTNLRTRLGKIIRRAGLEPWPKLFMNLRASCETELVKEHPIHVVTDWLGNTPSVAAKHYLQTTEADYRRALEKPVQKPVQNPPVSTCIESNGQTEGEWESGLCGSITGDAASCNPGDRCQLTPGGLEPPLPA